MCYLMFVPLIDTPSGMIRYRYCGVDGGNCIGEFIVHQTTIMRHCGLYFVGSILWAYC